MELTPREEARTTARPRRNKLPYAVVAVVLLALGFVVVQGLSNATLYFYNADEAVAQHDDLGDGRFRLQGEVVEGSVGTVGDQVHFLVAHGGEQVRVEHFGDPPELFQPGIPVVLEGRWADGSSAADPAFASDRILVKHSSEYKAENPERVDEYDTTVEVDEAP